jgi:Tol biopolymer transport system component
MRIQFSRETLSPNSEWTFSCDGYPTGSLHINHSQIFKFSNFQIARWLLPPTLVLLCAFSLHAQRVPVLNQIDLPHSYYYRELYLPQLTSGPSSAAWTPDGKSLVYSMAGSLWLQTVGSPEAQQLTDEIGYDYQPDVSPDGKRILFVRYSGESMDVMVLNLEEKKSYMLTDGKSVSLEPRWSPDGSQLAFVSTDESGHFLLHTATVNGNQLDNAKVLIADRKTEAKRYYYSAWDHSINPAWSRDGKKIYFVNNHDVAYGTGNLQVIDLASGEIATIQKEETNWRMRPDISPDGTRIVYSSYLGQNWHQLWLLPAEGGYPVPITYGHYDKSAPRWSPDGKKIAFISNEDGNTALWVLDAFTGKQEKISPTQLNYLSPRVALSLSAVDEEGKTIPARFSVVDGRGKFYAPRESWIHADDSRYPTIQKIEPHYFHAKGPVTIMIPKHDSIRITASHGPAFSINRLKTIARQVDAVNLKVKVTRLALPPDFGSWRNGDLHVHMNYGGNYRNTPAHTVKQAEAEDLNFVYNLIVNKEQRIPDVAIFQPGPDPASTANTTFLFGQEFHTSFWGHLGLLNLSKHLILPDYSGYPNTAAASLYPHNTFVADQTHAQEGLVGYVHPFEQSEIFPQQSPTLSNALPVDAALGKVDYYELVGFSDHKASEAVWYHLLNVGLKIPAAAGTDAMANYASLRGPVGLNRVYVRGKEAMTSPEFLDQVKRGKSFVTNGPLLGFQVEGLESGDSLNLDGKKKTLSYKGWLRSNVPVEKVEVIYNGQVVATHASAEPATMLDITGKIAVRESGWVLLRAWSAGGHVDLFDLYPYASTNPIFLFGGTKPATRAASAAFFVTWIDRLEKLIRQSTSFRDESERVQVLNDILRAREYYTKR